MKSELKLEKAFAVGDVVVEKVGKIGDLDIYQDKESEEISVLFFVNKRGWVVGKIKAESFSGAYNSTSVGVSIFGYGELIES